MSVVTHRFYAVASAILVTLSACSSNWTDTGGGGGSTPGSIALSLSPTSATIQQGGSTQLTGTLTRTSFTGDVTITVAGAPSGLTPTVVSLPNNGSNSAVVTLAASAQTPVGTYPLTVTVHGSGVSDASATFTLTISAATPSSIALSLGTPTLSVAQGSSGSSTISISRTAFTGTVAFTADNLPTGATATFTPSSTTDNSSSVNINVPSTVATGTYTVVVRGTAPGLMDATATLTLTVNAEARVLTLTSGGGQSAEAGSALANPVVVTLTRQSDHAAVAGAKVAFVVTAGGGSVSADTVTTDASGKAQVNWTLGTTAGATQQLTASSVGATSITVSATAVAGTPGLSGIVAISAGFSHACALNTAGVVYCWGDNTKHELGNPGFSTYYSARPLAVTVAGQTWASVSAGYLATCARTTTGAVYCWGEGDYGGIGNGAGTTVFSPTQVSSVGAAFAQIASGAYFRCGITAGNQPFCWGDNYYYELGDGTTVAQRNSPVMVTGGHTFVQIVNGPNGYTTCGLTSAGAAWCWGDGFDGEFGNGTDAVYSDVPVQVSGGNVFTKLAGGDTNFCGQLANGSWMCWGKNDFGALEPSEAEHKTPFALQTGGLTFVQLALGDTHTCGRTADNHVYCWGYNGSGQLGTGNLSSQGSPTPVSGNLLFSSISAGDAFTCGVTTSGSVYCWGSNAAGQLGDDIISYSSTPVKIPPP